MTVDRLNVLEKERIMIPSSSTNRKEATENKQTSSSNTEDKSKLNKMTKDTQGAKLDCVSDSSRKVVLESAETAIQRKALDRLFEDEDEDVNEEAADYDQDVDMSVLKEIVEVNEMLPRRIRKKRKIVTATTTMKGKYLRMYQLFFTLTNYSPETEDIVTYESYSEDEIPQRNDVLNKKQVDESQVSFKKNENIEKSDKVMSKKVKKDVGKGQTSLLSFFTKKL